MNRVRRSFTLNVALFSIGGILLALSEPCDFLDEELALLLIRHLPTHNSGRVSEITLPADSSEARIGAEIALQKAKGTRGVLLFLLPKEVTGEATLAAALAMKDVVWVADPSVIPPALRGRATCRPLLVCNGYGSAVIAVGGTNALLSATAVALTCTEDSGTLKHLGTNTFKMLFQKVPYKSSGGGTNVAVVGIAKDRQRDGWKYNTPGGQKTAPEYALDICQAVLDRRYLIEIRLYTKCEMAGILTPLLGCIGKGVHRLTAFVAILLLMIIIELIEKLQLPIGTVLLLFLFVSVISPVLCGRLWRDLLNS